MLLVKCGCNASNHIGSPSKHTTKLPDLTGSNTPVSISLVLLTNDSGEKALEWERFIVNEEGGVRLDIDRTSVPPVEGEGDGPSCGGHSSFLTRESSASRLRLRLATPLLASSALLFFRLAVFLASVASSRTSFKALFSFLLASVSSLISRLSFSIDSTYVFLAKNFTSSPATTGLILKPI